METFFAGIVTVWPWMKCVKQVYVYENWENHDEKMNFGLCKSDSGYPEREMNRWVTIIPLPKLHTYSHFLTGTNWWALMLFHLSWSSGIEAVADKSCHSGNGQQDLHGMTSQFFHVCQPALHLSTSTLTTLQSNLLDCFRVLCQTTCQTWQTCEAWLLLEGVPGVMRVLISVQSHWFLWFLFKNQNNLLRHLVLYACILLSVSAVFA